MVMRQAPALLQEFVDSRRGWYVLQEKQDCWVAQRRITLVGRELLFLVTPNWREKHLGTNWVGEVIDTPNDNARLASHRGLVSEVLGEMRRAERTVELGLALSTPHISRQAALELLSNVRGAQLGLLRKALGVRSASASIVRVRIVDAACGGQSTAKAGM